jgi:DNA-binding NtrC family response regulator
MIDKETIRDAPRQPVAAEYPVVLLRCYPFGAPPRMRQYVLGRITLIGRSPESHVQVEDGLASREHAVLVKDPWSLGDRGSANGTFVNGERIENRPLFGGEIIRIGGTIFRFLTSGFSERTENLVPSTSGMISGPSLGALRSLMDRAACSDLNVFVTGETGTGKELAARYLHDAGGSQRPFMAVNCAALPAHLIESELFGHVKGAFTGAAGEHAGLVRQAEGGTLFLDEIGELPLDCQAKLLRVLQDRCVRPVGSTRSVPVQFKLVSATNQDLPTCVEKGRFRADLFARIAELVVSLPPLRARCEDIPLLLTAFLERHGGRGRTIPIDVMDALCSRSWPMNIRQLENAVRRALLLAGDAPVLGLQHFSEPEIGKSAPPLHLSERPADPSTTADADGDESEARRLKGVLERTGGDADMAAAALHISRSQLYRRAQKLGIRLKQFRNP